MAYILFAAKFLFCLDGNAENLSSDFAEKINQYVIYFLNHSCLIKTAFLNLFPLRHTNPNPYLFIVPILSSY